MEAMIVSPAPGPQPFKPKSNNENQSGSESTFAPTLDSAIKDKKSSTSSPSNDSRSNPSIKASEEAQDTSKDVDVNEDIATQSHAAQSSNSNTELTEKSKGQVNTSAVAMKYAASIVKNGEQRLSSSQIVDDISNNKKTGSFDVKTNQMGLSQLKNTPVQVDLATSKSSKESAINAQFMRDHIHGNQSQRAGNTVYLQNNDTISWNQSKSNPSNMVSQNTALMQHISEDHKVNNSSAIRVERFTATAELASQNIGENTDKTPPLSVERIAAKLTDVPLQANQSTLRIRDNVSSLRQDTQGQFIEAKLENIDKKSNTQSDQQSLGSESESTQKNALAASAKTLDKSPESSFSQSLQNITTEKPTGSGIDTLRPGSPVFTSQIHENNILHQVLHKFRISQHLQDSRLVMKLHPAELGDLKIDVQLKDGTINANILAQTQQVQDILEKNMPRLKALMEEQGLLVNEITIKLDSDVSDNKNMFEEHLSQDENGFAKRKNVASSVPFELEQEIIEEAEIGAQQPLSGVNVMI